MQHSARGKSRCQPLIEVQSHSLLSHQLYNTTACFRPARPTRDTRIGGSQPDQAGNAFRLPVTGLTRTETLQTSNKKEPGKKISTSNTVIKNSFVSCYFTPPTAKKIISTTFELRTPTTRSFIFIVFIKTESVRCCGSRGAGRGCGLFAFPSLFNFFLRQSQE